MSLSPFSFVAKTIEEYQQWFNDIFNHLSASNYDNGDWTPVITGMTGSPTVTAWFQRFGIVCNFTIIIDGTHSMSSAEITLPLAPDGYGVAVIHSITDNTNIETAYIDTSSDNLMIPDYSVTDKVVIINGNYKVEGI